MTSLRQEQHNGHAYDVLELPIRTRSEANSRGSWAPRARRAKLQREAIVAGLWAYMSHDHSRDKVMHVVPTGRPSRPFVEVPCASPRGEYYAGLALYPIRLVRVAPRTLDDDNLSAALKAVRDATAQWLFGGRTGQHDGMARWAYDQHRGDVRQYGVEVWVPTFEVAAC